MRLFCILTLVIVLSLLFTPSVAHARGSVAITRDIVTILERSPQNARGDVFYTDGDLSIVGHEYFDGTWQAAVSWRGVMVASLDRQTLIIIDDSRAWQKALHKSAKGRQ